MAVRRGLLTLCGTAAGFAVATAVASANDESSPSTVAPQPNDTDVPTDEIRPEVNSLVNGIDDLIEESPNETETAESSGETDDSAEGADSTDPGVDEEPAGDESAEPESGDEAATADKTLDSARAEPGSGSIADDAAEPAEPAGDTEPGTEQPGDATAEPAEPADPLDDAERASDPADDAERPAAEPNGDADVAADDTDLPLLDLDGTVGKLPDKQPVTDTVDELLDDQSLLDSEEPSELLDEVDKVLDESMKSPGLNDTGELLDDADDVLDGGLLGDSGGGNQHSDTTELADDLGGLLDDVKRDERADGPFGDTLGSIGEDVVDPLVDETTDQLSDVLHDTSDTLQGDIADDLLGDVLDDTGRLADGARLPLIGDTVEIADGLLDNTVIPLLDGTLGTVGELTDDTVLPVVDDTLELVDELTGVVTPLVDDTLGDTGGMVDNVVEEIPILRPILNEKPSDDSGVLPELDVLPLPDGQTPQGFAEREQGDSARPDKKSGRDGASGRSDTDMHYENAVDLAVGVGPVDGAGAADETDDTATISSPTSGGADTASGMATAGSAGGSAGGVDLAYDAPVPMSGFLVICRAHAPPGLLERPRNPSVRPD